MKKSIAIAMFVLAGLGAMSASAQDHATKATVPFDFYVGNTWVPAGHYIVTEPAGSPFLTVRNVDKNMSVIRMGGPSEQAASSNQLIFDRYGDKLFLREVLSASGGLKVELPVSKTERRAQEQTASAGQPTTVYLALR